MSGPLLSLLYFLLSPNSCSIFAAVAARIGVAGLEPAVSCSRSRRISHLSHTPRKCPAGFEPARSPWQGERLPLHHGHYDRRRIVKETQSTGWGSNPRHRLTRAVSCLLDHQCKPRVGPEGLEPSLAWLRARCAAANTLVPTIASSRPGRSRTSIFRLSAERSAAELQAVIADCRSSTLLPGWGRRDSNPHSPA